MSSFSPLIGKALGALLFGTFATMLIACLWFPFQLAQGAFQDCFDAPDRKPVPWRVTSVGLILVLYVVVHLAVEITYVELRSLTGFHQTQPQVVGKVDVPKPIRPAAGAGKVAPAKANFSFTEMMVLISVINGILLLVVPPVLRLTSKATWQDLGLTSHEFMRNVKVGAAAFLVVTPMVMGLQLLALQVWKSNRHPVEKMLRDEASPSVVVLAYFSAVVLGPFVEELLFRGVIQGWIRGEFRRPPRRRPAPDDAIAVSRLDESAVPEGDAAFAPYRPPVSNLDPPFRKTSTIPTNAPAL